MLKAFSRWLFMRTHHAELVACACAARAKGHEAGGICAALEMLDLCVR